MNRALVAAAFCSTALSARAQARLWPLDSVRVVEAESSTFALISRLAVGRLSYFVTDREQKRVFEITRNGRTVRALGRTGSGPNEMRIPSVLALSGDTILTVVDQGQQKLVTWDLRTRSVITSLPLTNWLTTIRYHAGGLYVASLSSASSAVLTSYSPDGRTISLSGTAPAIFKETPPLLSMFGTVLTTHDAGWVYAAFETDENLHRWREGERATEIQAIPKAHRKGVRASLFSELMRDPSRASTLAYDRSLTILLEQMRPSVLGFVALDGHLEKNRFIGRYWLTVIDIARSRACADVAVPGEEDPLPVISLVGDTLAVLQQGITATGAGITWIKRYRIDTAACSWLPLGSRREGAR